MIALRNARFTDCLAVWRWNFAPDVRAMSKTKEEPPLAEHAAWFARRLRSQNPTLIIVEDGEPVGVVRLDLGRDHSRISIAIAPEARGRGVGREAIALACRHTMQPILAEVARENAASRRCFEACGFEPVDGGAELVSYRWSHP